MTRGNKFGVILIIVMSALIAFLIMEISKDSKKDIKKVEKIDKEFDREVVEERGNEYPVSMDDSSSIVNTDSASYWYVYFHVSRTLTSYDGYEVIRLNTGYFDVNEAVHIILPDCDESDYVGVNFFKQVNYETYLSYLKIK